MYALCKVACPDGLRGLRPPPPESRTVRSGYLRPPPSPRCTDGLVELRPNPSGPANPDTANDIDVCALPDQNGTPAFPAATKYPPPIRVCACQRGLDQWGVRNRQAPASLASMSRGGTGRQLTSASFDAPSPSRAMSFARSRVSCVERRSWNALCLRRFGRSPLRRHPLASRNTVSFVEVSESTVMQLKL